MLDEWFPGSIRVNKKVSTSTFPIFPFIKKMDEAKLILHKTMQINLCCWSCSLQLSRHLLLVLPPTMMMLLSWQPPHCWIHSETEYSWWLPPVKVGSIVNCTSYFRGYWGKWVLTCRKYIWVRKYRKIVQFFFFALTEYGYC